MIINTFERNCGNLQGWTKDLASAICGNTRLEELDIFFIEVSFFSTLFPILPTFPTLRA
jgi:hypothetical protein